MVILDLAKTTAQGEPHFVGDRIRREQQASILYE
jgi:hypothetical protein